MTTTLPAFVSVVVATFERGYCVADAVESVLAQTHAEVECVVVDDGSTDGTVAHLAHHFGRDPRGGCCTVAIRRVRSAQPGVRAAHGELVTFLDSDDLLGPHCSSASSAASLTVPTRWSDVSNAPSPARRVAARAARSPRSGAGYCARPCSRPGDTCSRSVVSDEQLTTGEDIDLLARLVGCGLWVARLEQTIVSARCFGDNLITLMNRIDRRGYEGRRTADAQHAAAG